VAEASDKEPHGQGEFARFEALTKQLLDVPKATVDAAVKKAKRERSARRDRRRQA